MADGYRASAEAWAGLLRDCARRRMRAPVMAVGDDALGFWKALREVAGRGPAAATVTRGGGAAQARRRAVNGAHLVPLVRAGARFERGLSVERPEAVAA